MSALSGWRFDNCKKINHLAAVLNRFGSMRFGSFSLLGGSSRVCYLYLLRRLFRRGKREVPGRPEGTRDGPNRSLYPKVGYEFLLFEDGFQRCGQGREFWLRAMRAMGFLRLFRLELIENDQATLKARLVISL
jgi:hypothetical protein